MEKDEKDTDVVKVRSSDVELIIENKYVVSRKEQIKLIKECIRDAMHFPERPDAIPAIAACFFQYRILELHRQFMEKIKEPEDA